MCKYNTILVEDKRNYLLVGASGTGKTHFIENYFISVDDEVDDEVERFYASKYSSYEDLFGSYMPKSYKDKDDENKLKVKYVFEPGPMARILKAAMQSQSNNDETPNKKYILVIENINEANTYELFGDLFQLLDRSSANNESEYAVSLSEEAKEWFKEEFPEFKEDKIRLPKNLYVICTMNPYLPNGYKLDTAFRRRFSMVYFDFNGDIYGNIENTIEDEECNNSGFRVCFDENATEDVIEKNKWNGMRNIINPVVAEKGEDKQVSERFIKFTKYTDSTSDEKEIAGKTDVLIALYSHLLENVYRTKKNDVLGFENVLDALKKLHPGKTQENDSKTNDEIKNELFKKDSLQRLNEIFKPSTNDINTQPQEQEEIIES